MTALLKETLLSLILCLLLKINTLYLSIRLQVLGAFRYSPFFIWSFQ